MFVCVQVAVNEEVDPALVVHRLTVENAALKAELRCAGAVTAPLLTAPSLAAVHED